MSKEERLVVRRALVADASELALFYQLAGWDSKATEETVRSAWERRLANGVEEIAAIAVLDGRIVGFCGSIPFQVWCNGSAYTAHWLKGLMILPEVRNGPLGFMVLKELAGMVRSSGAMVVASPALRLFNALGYQDLGKVPEYLYVLRGSAIIRHLAPSALSNRGRVVRTAGMFLTSPPFCHVAGALLSVVLLGRRHLFGEASKGHRIKCSLADQFCSGVDKLWNDLKLETGCAAVRDSQNLGRRYNIGSSDSDAPYRLIVAHEGAELVGLMVLRVPSKRQDAEGARLAVLSDALLLPGRNDVCLELIRAILKTCRGEGVDGLVAGTTSAQLGESLSKSGFLVLPPRIHFLWRGERRSEGFPNLKDWWLLYGDGSADTAFSD